MARALKGCILAFAFLAPGACAAQPYVVLAGEHFTVEIADSPEERARGLMYREQLAADGGMLFIYPRPAPRAFWMKNTRIPLDILFFDADGRFLNVHTAAPCKRNPCPVYPSDGDALLVLELRAGTANAIGVQSGAPLEVHFK